MPRPRHEILNDIRARFVGTAEEHESLKSITDRYDDIYREAKDHFDVEQQDRIEGQRHLLAMAQAYTLGCPIDAMLTEMNGENSDWRINEIAQRLKLLKVSHETLDVIIARFKELTP